MNTSLTNSKIVQICFSSLFDELGSPGRGGGEGFFLFLGLFSWLLDFGLFFYKLSIEMRLKDDQSESQTFEKYLIYYILHHNSNRDIFLKVGVGRLTSF